MAGNEAVAGRATPAETPGRVRLRTLVYIRWIAVLGQLLTLMVVRYGLGFELPFGVCIAVIAISAALNVAITLRRPTGRSPDRSRRRPVSRPTTSCSSPCCCILTGGLQNPFSVLILSPVVVSATVLPRGSTDRARPALGRCDHAAGALAPAVAVAPRRELRAARRLCHGHLGGARARRRVHRRLCRQRLGRGAAHVRRAGRDADGAGARAAACRPWARSPRPPRTSSAARSRPSPSLPRRWRAGARRRSARRRHRAPHRAEQPLPRHPGRAGARPGGATAARPSRGCRSRCWSRRRPSRT